ncbi:MAG: N-acetyl sugar amidotransferase [Rhodospirillales bacterium]
MSFKYPKRRTIDFGPYSPSSKEQPQARYGLPSDILFCSGCGVSNQRPSSAVEFKHTAASKKQVIHFNEDGRCDACHRADQKQKIDWAGREKELRELCARHRRTDGEYDCLVPGSGGKDSFYAAHRLKYEFGMHPLTVTWAPHIYTDWGWRNFESWIHAGFDNVLTTPNGRVHRLLTRLALENLCHPFQPFIIGQKALAPKLSAQYGIPLVFYGEGGADYGNPLADASTALQNRDFFTNSRDGGIHLGGTSVAELTSDYGVEHVDLKPYLPEHSEVLEKAGTQVHHLGYYLKWHPQSVYYYTMEHSGFQPSPERTVGTYSKYNSIDDKIDDFHYYTTFIKFGIGRATYDAAQEVRSGDITRDEAVALIRRYDGEFPERFADEIFRYLSITEEEFGPAARNFEQPVVDRAYFDNLTDSFRSPHIWKHENGAWVLRRRVYDDVQG